MKFYQVRYSKEGGNSGGFSWHTNRKDARTAARVDYDANQSEYDDHGEADLDMRISEIYVNPTKQGILRALRLFASHPDNG